MRVTTEATFWCSVSVARNPGFKPTNLNIFCNFSFREEVYSRSDNTNWHPYSRNPRNDVECDDSTSLRRGPFPRLIC